MTSDEVVRVALRVSGSGRAERSVAAATAADAAVAAEAAGGGAARSAAREARGSMTCRVLAFDGVRVAAVGVAVEGVPVETLAVDGVAVAGVAVDGVAIGVAAASLDTGGAAGTCALLDGVLPHRVLAVVLDEDARFQV